jgi:hypothetical protein
MSRHGDGLTRPRPTCYRCFRPRVTCICDSIEPVANRTGVVILQHPRERFHPIGTARIAALGLENVRVEICPPWKDGGALRSSLPPATALLYPVSGARELAALAAEERPRNLIVLDGTWFLAKKIYDAHPWLHELPHVALSAGEPSAYRIRRQPKDGYVATLEAIVCALGILEPATLGLDRLSRAFSAMIARQAAYVPERRAAAAAPC